MSTLPYVHDIVYVEGEYQFGLYVDGLMVSEGDRLEPDEAFQLASKYSPFVYRRATIDWDWESKWFEDHSNFPKDFSKVQEA